MKGGEQGGEIVQVDGGLIIRATGRKDRHSKVYTAKGPRDRRVRLSAHTAIQFYDVQDRLGYDRPSKAVDWLIKKAKAAIDRLNEAAPPWQTSHTGTPTPDSNPSSSDLGLDHQYEVIHPDNHNSSGGITNSSFMASSGEPDLMNTMKSLFPTNSFGGFSNHACQSSSFQAEDLGLSLQTIHGENERNSHFPFESFQRIDGWNNGGGGGGDHVEGRVGILLNSPQPIFSSFSQREFLQSNLAANQWNQRPLINPTNHHQHDHLQPRSSKSSNLDSPFELGFRVPARIYGEEEGDKHR